MVGQFLWQLHYILSYESIREEQNYGHSWFRYISLNGYCIPFQMRLLLEQLQKD